MGDFKKQFKFSHGGRSKNSMSGESVKSKVETVNVERKRCSSKMLTEKGRLIYNQLSKNKH